MLGSFPVAAQAQGYWQTGWTVKDSAGTIVLQNADGSFSLSGVPTGSASNTYDPTLTAQALASPYPVGTTGRQDDSLDINCYHPNKLEGRTQTSLAYLFGGTSPLTSALGVGTYAANYWVGPSGYFNQGFIPWPSDPRHWQYILVTGSSHAQATGTLLLYFNYTATWVGPGTPTPRPAAPPYINLLLTTGLSASASVNFPGGGRDTAKGRTASAAVSVPFFSEQVKAQASDGSSLLSSNVPPLQGRHLVRAAVSGDRAEVYVSGNVVVDANNPLPFLIQNDGDYWNPQPGDVTYSSGNASAALSAKVRQDNRDVIISCPSIETSYYKSEDGSTGYPIQLAHQRSTSGSLVTDSAVSPPLTQPGGGSTWTASPTLLGQASGFYSPVFAWSAAGSGSLITAGNSSQTILSVSFPLSSTNKSLGKQSTVNLKVTDSDGASGGNTYIINWHYPYENWQTQGSAFQNPPKAYHSTDGPQGANGQVHIPVTSAGIDWSIPGKIGGGIISTGLTVVGVLAPETSPLLLGFLSAAGYSLSVINSPPPPTVYSQQGTLGQFQSDISTELAIASGSTGGVFLPAVARMTPQFAALATGKANTYFSGPGGTLTFDATAYRVQWQQNYTGESYDTHGYAGSAPGIVHYEGAWNYVFNWTYAPVINPPH